MANQLISPIVSLCIVFNVSAHIYLFSVLKKVSETCQEKQSCAFLVVSLLSYWSKTLNPILYDSHMHTPLCKHARGKPEEYAKVASQRNLKGIIITCHNPGPKGWSPHIRMEMSQFEEYVTMVKHATELWAGQIDVRLGLESDYVPSMESFLSTLHGRANFNYILGSIHPHAPYYKNEFFHQDIVDFQRTYFKHIAMAAESGLFDAISHPDLVKNVFPQEWRIQRVWGDIQHALDRIAQTGVAMELNTSGLLKRIKEMNPSEEILAEMAIRKIPVVLGSDSHEPRRVGDHFEEALMTLKKVGYEHVYFFLNRERHQIKIEQAQASLQPLGQLKHA